MDNAKIHKSKIVKEFIECISIPVPFTGLASFLDVPVEMCFAHSNWKF